MNRTVRQLLVLLCVGLVPGLAFAQASISGVVRDTSGAILPGVTVEAASPALIEKVRSVVTDGSGQFQIIDLRPGGYTVTFTLPGFNTVKREGVQLEGAFAATLNIEMRVGALEETVTVTGEAPIVDVQNVRQQRVLTKEVIDTVPSGRTAVGMAVLIPAVTATGGVGGGVTQDVGGALGDVMTQLVAHGGRPTDSRLNLDGLPTQNDAGGGAYTSFRPNMSATAEVAVDSAAASAEQQTGGVRINLIPREGGNRFSGTIFGTGVNSSFQGSNYSDDLRRRGLRTPDSIKSGYEMNPGLGGPLLQDKAWFFIAGSKSATHNYVGEMYEDLNKNNPNAWTFNPDLTRPAVYKQEFSGQNVRLTWQASTKNKLSVYYDNQYRCQCPRVTSLASNEAAPPFRVPLQRTTNITWSAPLTSRLLVDAALGNRAERWRHRPLPGQTDAYVNFIGVTEQSNGIAYRNINTGANDQLFTMWNMRGSASYVTGSHALKVGFTNIVSQQDVLVAPNNPQNLLFRLNNGVPNQLTMHTKPYRTITDNPADLGIYVQDRWAMGRLTANLGLRFDIFKTSFPEQHVGPALLAPNRDLTFPASDFVNWKDWSPRLGAVYDLRGDGKTAFKVSLSKYMVLSAVSGTFGSSGNPINLLANAVTRAWNDTNRDFVPDCNLLEPSANGECGAMSDRNFGGATRTTAYDPDLINGWGKRQYNWEFSAGVQHEVMPRLSTNVSFFRRWYGNFTVTDNLAVSASDFDAYQITTPTDSRLPNGGGYVISGLKDLNPSKVGQVNNLFTRSNNYGRQTETWNGVDVTVDARLQRGVFVQGGLSTGVTAMDNCEVLAAVPESGPTLVPWCNQSTGFVTQVKLLGSYTVPGVGVQTSASFQSIAGPQLAANLNVPSATIAPSLGRPLSAGAANATVNLISPGSMFGERLNQLDLRFSRPFSIGNARRTTINLDVFNALNNNSVLVENPNFAVWRTPNRIVMARFARISLQFDF